MGLRPLVGKPSQGGLLVLGWSLGSTSMFKFTWNRSGYFSCMSQASKSYLAGETEGGKNEFKDNDLVGSEVLRSKMICELCKLDGGRVSGDKTGVELDLKHLHGRHLKRVYTMMTHLMSDVSGCVCVYTPWLADVLPAWILHDISPPAHLLGPLH